eukprot:3473725-Alexandrium_andersonii.AAC.1
MQSPRGAQRAALQPPSPPGWVLTLCLASARSTNSRRPELLPAGGTPPEHLPRSEAPSSGEAENGTCERHSAPEAAFPC